MEARLTNELIDLGGGFTLYREPARKPLIVATALAGTGVFGYASPIDVDARLDNDALAWLEGLGVSHERRLRSLDQVHGAACVAAGAIGFNARVEADAVWTSSHEDILIIRTADCAAVWLVDPEHAHFAMLHAGWRGAAEGIVRHTIDALCAHRGHPRTMIAVIGPHLGPCCFEVGPEVAELFAHVEGAVGPAALLTAPRQRSDSVSLNLAAVLAAQLVNAGVPSGAIHTATACTRCFRAFGGASAGEPVLHSYRRNGKGGPLMASVGVLER